MNKKLFYIAGIFIAFSCNYSSSLHDQMLSDSQRIIKSNLYFLASDELEGREATSRGAHVAAQFIASQLKQYGVKPFGDNNTYFQNFTLQKTKYLPESQLIINSKDSSRILISGENFIPFEQGSDLKDNELIFVGYGISDTSLGHDDYANIDVTGKTVMCMYGVPRKKEDPAYFRKGMKWAGSASKAKTALQKGAAAIIVIQSNYWIKKWTTLQKYIDGDVSEHKMETNKINAMWIDSTTVKSFFSQDLSYSALRDTLNSGFIPSGTKLDQTITISIKSIIDTLNARNVVGIIEGTDPALKYQYVSVSAHYDHEGIKNGQIYNGADDNGSGTVAILESARQVAALKNNKRPIIYAFVTAEEKGLLGSNYLTNNADYISDVVSNINVDMVGRESEDTLFVVGSGRISSEYFQIVEAANKESVNFVFDYSYDDEGHPERIYYRSDHWKFAQKGIPVVFFTDMHKTDYHKPTDDPEKINYKKIEKTARLTTQVSLKVANLNHKLILDNTHISAEK